MSTLDELSRTEKRDVASALLDKLTIRIAKEPKEEALEVFVPLFGTVIAGLDTGVEGKAVANAARKAQLARLELADSNVDTWYRHHYDYVNNEAIRRVGPFILDAIALRDAAFPDGLGPVDAYIPVENQSARNAIAAIREEAHAKTAESIGLPKEWTMKWEADLNESDAAFADVEKARKQTSSTVGTGVDAENDFVELAIRYRKYIQSRASRSEKAKLAEGADLLSPLTKALAKARAEAAARATRRKTAKGSDMPAPAGTPDTQEPK